MVPTMEMEMEMENLEAGLDLVNYFYKRSFSLGLPHFGMALNKISFLVSQGGWRWAVLYFPIVVAWSSASIVFLERISTTIMLDMWSNPRQWSSNYFSQYANPCHFPKMLTKGQKNPTTWSETILNILPYKYPNSNGMTHVGSQHPIEWNHRIGLDGVWLSFYRPWYLPRRRDR